MSGDGVSLPTTITQLGQLAKAQARSQQAATNTPGSLPAEEQENLQPVRKVKEAEPKGKRTLQRRRGRGGGQPDSGADQADAGDGPADEHIDRLDSDDDDPDRDLAPPDETTPPTALGGLIDTKA